MMVAWAAVVLALGAASPTEVRLASPGLSTVNVEEKTARFFSDYLAEQLGAQDGLDVTTGSQVDAVLGFERQRQLLGCAEADSNCLVELAGALGAEALLTGSLARFDSGYTVSVKVVSVAGARTLASAGAERLAGDDALLGWLKQAARSLASQVRLALGHSVPGGGLREVAWVPAAAGGGAVLLGGVLYGLAYADFLQLAERRPVADVDGLVARGELLQGAGLGLAGAGVAALLVGGGMALFGVPPQDGARVSVRLDARGGALVLGGVLP